MSWLNGSSSTMRIYLSQSMHLLIIDDRILFIVYYFIFYGELFTLLVRGIFAFGSSIIFWEVKCYGSLPENIDFIETLLLLLLLFYELFIFLKLLCFNMNPTVNYSWETSAVLLSSIGILKWNIVPISVYSINKAYSYSLSIFIKLLVISKVILNSLLINICLG